jgi:hypothetical protein
VKNIIEKILHLMELPVLAILECCFVATGLICFWIVLYGLFCLIKLVF